MLKITKKIMLLAVLLAIMIPSISFSQNDNDDFNMSYSVYSNNMYASGDDVTINVYAYYLRKNAEFNFKIYKIKERIKMP